MPMVPNMTVLQVISSAGGLSQWANQKHIYVMRTENGQSKRFPYNYKQAMRGRHEPGHHFAAWGYGRSSVGARGDEQASVVGGGGCTNDVVHPGWRGPKQANGQSNTTGNENSAMTPLTGAEMFSPGYWGRSSRQLYLALLVLHRIRQHQPLRFSRSNRVSSPRISALQSLAADARKTRSDESGFLGRWILLYQLC